MHVKQAYKDMVKEARKTFTREQLKDIDFYAKSEKVETHSTRYGPTVEESKLVTWFEILGKFSCHYSIEVLSQVITLRETPLDSLATRIHWEVKKGNTLVNREEYYSPSQDAVIIPFLDVKFRNLGKVGTRSTEGFYLADPYNFYFGRYKLDPAPERIK